MIELKEVTKEYSKGIAALNGINLTIEQGEFVFIVGDSGSGKSTLIRLLMKEIDPTSGTIIVNGQNLNRMKHRQIPQYRRGIGVVFQDFRLLKDRNIYENIAFAQRVTEKSSRVIKKKVPAALSLVGLAQKYKAYPKELSGGEQQRVAIARALVNDPKILLCDEATSALDPRITKGILTLLKKINEELGITIIVVTHQMEVVKEICQRVAFLKHGVVLAEGKPEELFVQPSADIKKFLGEEGQALPKDGVNIQLFFLDTTSDEPVVTEMARELNIDFSICWGKLEEFRSNVFGSLVINVNPEHKDSVVKYLESKNVKCEVL